MESPKKVIIIKYLAFFNTYKVLPYCANGCTAQQHGAKLAHACARARSLLYN